MEEAFTVQHVIVRVGSAIAAVCALGAPHRQVTCERFAARKLLSTATTLRVRHKCGYPSGFFSVEFKLEPPRRGLVLKQPQQIGCVHVAIADSIFIPGTNV